MINLLPPELKQNYQYARRNVSLRRWLAMCLVSLIGLGALATYGLVSVQQNTKAYEKEVKVSQVLLEQKNYADVQKQVQDISNSFKLAVKVLGQEVLFSKLISQVGASIPRYANLTSLTINQTQGGLDIIANAIDYRTATQVQVNLADPANKIFSRADLVNISCNGNTEATGEYPCTVTVRALFAKDNPYLFINSQGKTR